MRPKNRSSRYSPWPPNIGRERKAPSGIRLASSLRMIASALPVIVWSQHRPQDQRSAGDTGAQHSKAREPGGGSMVAANVEQHPESEGTEAGSRESQQ